MSSEPTLDSVLAAHKLQIIAHPDGVKVIDFGTLEVDDKKVDEQLDALGLVRFDQRVEAKNFPGKRGKFSLSMKLVNMGKNAQARGIAATIKQHAHREGDILELLAIHKFFPKLAQHLWMVSLGSPLRDYIGYPLVTVLYKRGGRCGIRIICYEDVQDFDAWFVAVGLPVTEQ